MNVIYGAKINSRWELYQLQEYLERNAEILAMMLPWWNQNPQEKQKNYLEKYDLIQPEPFLGIPMADYLACI